MPWPVNWILALEIVSVCSHFGWLRTSCLKTVSAEFMWHLRAPVSLANSSSQNGVSFHTVRFEFPADSSSPSDAKRMCRLEVTAATQVDSVWYGVFCFPQMFSLLLLALGAAAFLSPVVVYAGAASSVLRGRSLGGRCYSLARTMEYCHLSVYLLERQTSQVNMRQNKLWVASCGHIASLQSALTPLLGGSPQSSRKHLATLWGSLSTLWTFSIARKYD